MQLTLARRAKMTTRVRLLTTHSPLLSNLSPPRSCSYAGKISMQWSNSLAKVTFKTCSEREIKCFITNLKPYTSMLRIRNRPRNLCLTWKIMSTKRTLKNWLRKSDKTHSKAMKVLLLLIWCSQFTNYSTDKRTRHTRTIRIHYKQVI